MRSHYLIWLTACLWLITNTLYAQENAERIQEFYSQVTPQNPFVYFDLFGVEAGTTIYLYAESDEIDTYLVLCDLDCEETFAENDDIDLEGGNYNSALQYTFEADGDYSIAITDCCVSDTTGIFRLLLGYNAPDVLTDDAFPNGARIAVPYGPTYTDLSEPQVTDGAGVQQVYGTVDSENEFAVYELIDVSAGQTLYAYAESDEIDTYIVVCRDNACDEIIAENDDIDLEGGNYNSALQVTFDETGDYTLLVYDCCSSEASGTFRLLLSYAVEAVLNGTADPTGASIVEEFSAGRSTISTTPRTFEVGCSADGVDERPVLSGPMLTRETPNFIIHYTLDGDDATTERFVDEVAIVAESTYVQQIEQQGWAAPLLDCGAGGDRRYDIYLEEILTSEDVLGYAQRETLLGDNPASPRTEEWAASGFLAIDNDFKGTTAPIRVMRATVDHEFNHLVQFGYDLADEQSWYYEATASWMETQAHPEDQDVVDYTESVFFEPDLCIGSANDETGLRIYGEWLLIDSLAQDFGGPAIIKLWEYIADFEGMTPFYSYLDDLGTTPQDVIRRYAVRNLLRHYEIGSLFPEVVAIEAVIDDFGSFTPSRDGVEELAVDYMLVRRKGIYGFRVQPANFDLVMVGISRDDEPAQVIDLGQSGVVDTTRFSHAYLIVMNTTQHDDPAACTMVDWSITVTDGNGQEPTLPNGETFDIMNFAPAG